MQIIELDINKCEAPEPIYAKQSDVGRKFKVRVLDGDSEYSIPAGTELSVWYSGTSGSGNYTVIADQSAVTVDGATVTVELIAQMLTNRGGGNMCLILSACDGSQLGLWNIPYIVEPIPGAGSTEAQQYYSAFTDVANKALQAAASFQTDTTLSKAGLAADAKTTGGRIRGLEAKTKSELLWQNASGNSSFVPQHVTLNSNAANYDMLCIIWRHSTSLGYMMPSFLSRSMLSRTSMIHFKPANISVNAVAEAWRYVNWYDDATDLSFHRGMRDGVSDDTAAIPIAVYGFNL